MQRRPKLGDDISAQPGLDTEDEKRKARLNVIANVAAFGVIITLLRISE